MNAPDFHGCVSRGVLLRGVSSPRESRAALSLLRGFLSRAASTRPEHRQEANAWIPDVRAAARDVPWVGQFLQLMEVDVHQPHAGVRLTEHSLELLPFAKSALTYALAKCGPEMRGYLLGDLPLELVVRVFTWLDAPDLINVGATARCWSALDANLAEIAAGQVVREARGGASELLNSPHAWRRLHLTQCDAFFLRSSGTSITMPPYTLSSGLSRLWVLDKCIPSGANPFTFTGVPFSKFTSTNPALCSVVHVSVGGQGDVDSQMFAPGPELNVPGCTYTAEFALGVGRFWLVIDGGFNLFHGRLQVELNGRNVLRGQDPRRVWASSAAGDQAAAMTMGCVDQYCPEVSRVGIFAIEVDIDRFSTQHVVSLTVPEHRHPASMGNYICLQGVSFIPFPPPGSRTDKMEVCSLDLPGYHRCRRNGRQRGASSRLTKRAHVHYIMHLTGPEAGWCEDRICAGCG